MIKFNVKEVLVENIKCGGCANTIRNKLIEVEGFENVDVNIETGKIIIESTMEVDKELVYKILAGMGYTTQGR